MPYQPLFDTPNDRGGTCSPGSGDGGSSGGGACPTGELVALFDSGGTVIPPNSGVPGSYGLWLICEEINGPTWQDSD